MDLLFHNGLVLITRGGDPAPTAVGVAGDRIVAVGRDELLDAATAETRIVDLDGRTLLPGINDGHLHIGGFASGRPPTALDVSPAAVSTIGEIVALVAERSATLPAGSWIRGRGWTASHLTDLSADQRISVNEAVEAYTAAGAWQDDAESWKRTIAEGCVADLCVVDGRLSTDDPHTFADMAVSMTVVGGAVVHDTAD